MTHAALTQVGQSLVSFRDLDTTIGATTDGLYGITRYPAKFIPQVVHYVLDENPSIRRVCDPFAGVGTTGIASHLRRKQIELWDINPLVAHYHKAHSLLLSEGIPDEDYVINAISAPVRSLRLSIGQDEIEYLSRWYHPLIFEHILSLWNTYYQLDPQAQSLLLFPLLKISASWSYNDLQRQKLCRSPRSVANIAHRLSKPDWDATLVGDLCARVRDARSRYEWHHERAPWRYDPLISINTAVDGETRSSEADTVITSPPYLQAQEYIRASKLSLLWLGHDLPSIRSMMRQEIPYNAPNTSVEIVSPLYRHIVRFYERNGESQAVRVLESYFSNTLDILNRAAAQASQLYLFVGSAGLRGNPVPLSHIFAEHLVLDGGWEHSFTLNDPIVAKTLFASAVNPASGRIDVRMSTEQLVVLKR